MCKLYFIPDILFGMKIEKIEEVIINFNDLYAFNRNTIIHHLGKESMWKIIDKKLKDAMNSIDLNLLKNEDNYQQLANCIVQLDFEDDVPILVWTSFISISSELKASLFIDKIKSIDKNWGWVANRIVIDEKLKGEIKNG